MKPIPSWSAFGHWFAASRNLPKVDPPFLGAVPSAHSSNSTKTSVATTRGAINFTTDPYRPGSAPTLCLGLLCLRSRTCLGRPPSPSSVPVVLPERMFSLLIGRAALNLHKKETIARLGQGKWLTACCRVEVRKVNTILRNMRRRVKPKSRVVGCSKQFIRITWGWLFNAT